MTEVKLSVVKRDTMADLQFEIVSNWEETTGEWEDRYIAIGGYFGSIGPNVFRSALELLDALETAVKYVNLDAIPLADAAKIGAALSEAKK